MAGIFSWSSTPGSNTTVDGINIDEGCPAGNVNNALRSIMALVKATFASGLEAFLAGSAALGEANGGTGRTTGAAAKGANNDITSLTGLTTPLSIPQGGTGQASAQAALAGFTGQTGTAPFFIPRAWVNFNGSTGAIIASGNVASITKNATGDYTVTFTTALPDASYGVLGMASGGGVSNPSGNVSVVGEYWSSGANVGKAAGSCRIVVVDNNTDTLGDVLSVTVWFIR